MSRTSMTTLIAGLVITVAAPAAAQVKANASIGFSHHTKVFNKDGERVEVGSGNEVALTDISITLGAAYDIWMGLYAGADLNIVHRSQDTTAGLVTTNRKRFDIREIHLNLGYAADLGLMSVDVGAGFKIDVAKQEDLAADELAVSDSNHAFKAHVMGKANLGVAGIGAHLGIVVPFEREIKNRAGTLTRFENGVVVDPRLLLHFGFSMVSVGLDLGLIYRGNTTTNGVVNQDSDLYVLHVIPHVGVNFGGHSVTFAMGFQDEDYMLGIPIVGKNHKAPEIPPMSLSWKGSF